ncbi:MAG: hypothetical protein Q8L34_03500 [Candidatus Woesearchaeota archaeon]|nr:hypothetical protein [Candidatus Woesearchaeota archaeon]
MDKNDDIFKENVKKSFLKAKEDISNIENQFKELKELFSKQNKDILALYEKIEYFFKENSKKEDKIDFFNSSIGNKGVVNNRQQSTVNHQQSSTMQSNEQQWISDDQAINNNQQQTLTSEQKRANQPPFIRNSLDSINQTLTFRFKTLTDREFSVFLAIYELEKQLSEVTYADLANKLSLTETTIRSCVNRLVSKQLPLTKERFFNKKTTLTIDKNFKELSLLNKLINIRSNNSDQKSLLDI